ncbi:MAG: hypothetical protein IJY36_05435 [Coprobacter sp.]|nr:hypothetical protein [Coprobacter sp.]
MSFVKSILQQWRERNQKRDSRSDSMALPLSTIPGKDLAEQHLLEALARQINDMVASGQSITEVNIDAVYERLSDTLATYSREAQNIARNELSEKWREEEERRMSEIKSLQEQLLALTQKCDEAQKRYLSAERMRQTVSDRMHDLEGRLITAQREYERDIEEKLRQINKIKAYSLGLLSDDENEQDVVAEIRTYGGKEGEAVEEEKVFDCDTVGDTTDAAVIVKHRYASLYGKLAKAQEALQEQRKENRVIVKRDLRHQQRIKVLQETVQELRRELRRLIAELEQIRRKTDKKDFPATSENSERKIREKYPLGFASSIFDDEDMEE